MIKIAILGTGFGLDHLKIFSKFKDVEIAGIFGRNREKLEKINKEFGVYTTTDIDELLDNNDIDLIDICLPTKLHFEYAVKSLKKGKHVFCETPVCYSYEEALKIRELSEQFNKHVMVDLFMLFSPEHRYVYDTIKSGRLGDIKSVFINRRTPPIWGNINPMIFNLLIHDFDFISWLMGEPEEITGHGVKYNSDDYEFITSVLKYKNSYAVIEGASQMPKSFTFNMSFRAACTKGAIDFAPYTVNGEYEPKFIVYPESGPEEIVKVDYINEWEHVCRHVIDVLNGKEENSLISIKRAASALKLAIAAKKSIENNGDKIFIGKDYE